MKWINKGHEFDSLYEIIKTKKSFYLFGAGDYGNLFLKEFKDEINIKGFIDNDLKKQKSGCCGYKVFPLDILQTLKDDEAVILTISQFARASAREQLEHIGLKEHTDYILFEEFMSVYYIYKYDKVFMSTISFLPSTICNLKCRYCLNFNPFSKQFYKRNINELKQDIDLFFSKVDRVMIFHLSGGEPMLYPHITDLIRYIDEKYVDRIGVFRTVTNGTIIPDDSIVECLSQCNVEVTVDDYREAVPQYSDNFLMLIEKLDKFKVNYIINKADSWVDLAPEKTDLSELSEDKLIKHFDECCQTWHELRDGKLFMCNYASYAQVAGLVGADIEEYLELSKINNDNKRELVEFRLGYSSRGYTEFCKKCRGFTKDNDSVVKPAVQVKGN